MGRRDNKYKARIKITIGAMGIDAFRARVHEAFQRLRPAFNGQDLAMLGDIQEYFAPPPYIEKSQESYFDALDSDIGFREWVERNVSPQTPKLRQCNDQSKRPR